MASSSQTSSQQSTSSPVVVETAENSIMNAISGVASGLAQQMLQWGQGVFAQTSQITNQAVGNFFTVSQKMLGLSNNLTDQYNDVFAPQNRSLAREADSYNSSARQKLEMGAAGATASQAGDAGLKAAEEGLRSFGIDPSSGRYAALDKAAAVQNAANIAGQENMARDRTAATGRQLRSEAVQVGATLPAAIANVNNTAIQANTGATNATLANANTGRALMELPNNYLQTAMGIKMPLMGNNSQSTGQSSGFSSNPTDPRSSSPSGGGGGNPGGGSPGGGGGGGPAWMPQHGADPAQAGGGGMGGGSPGYGRSGSMAGIMHLPGNGSDPGWDDPTGQNYDPFNGFDPDTFSGGGSQYQPENGYGMGVGQPGQSDDPFQWGGNDNPFSDPGFGQTFGGGLDNTFGGMSGGTDTPWGNISYDPSANSVDPGWGQMYNEPAPTNWGSGADPFTGGQSYNTTDPGSEYYAGNYTDPSSEYDPGGAYAAGGPIPPTASPSRGAITDDVPAQGPAGQPMQMNANEFVIPQDVALWKGQEFFQNLIQQSRQKRVGAPAKPSAMR